MKKTYFSPEIEVEEMDLSELLCVSGAEGGEDDGGSGVVEGDPSQPGWGDDF